MSAEIVSLYKSNFRDPAAMLRCIADGIESGKYGDVSSVGVVMVGDTMEVFGGGIDAEAPIIGMLLHAGFMRLSSSLESHGR